MTNVYCQGVESSILECSYSVTNAIYCNLESDAGVQCLGKGDASLSTYELVVTLMRDVAAHEGAFVPKGRFTCDREGLPGIGSC